MIKRQKHIEALRFRIKNNPVVAVLGPRQCGKTTLSRQFKSAEIFDLEKPQDLAALENPWHSLSSLKGLVVIDEIQRRPDLFPVLRALVDEKKGLKFLITGSASRDLIMQSSESLSGRISYYEVPGFCLDELGPKALDRVWVRGGFPRSYLARGEHASEQWREDYIQTFLERDIPQLGIQIPAHTLRRFWTLLAHYNGQILNYSEIGKNFGITDMTVRRYIDILAGTFMVRVLSPWHANVGKRQIKSPKLYFSDTGIFHQLMLISGKKALLSQPKLGASWETFVLRELLFHLNGQQIYFWHTSGGAEIDFVFETKKGLFGVEAKFTDSPKVTPSMRSALKDLGLKKILVVFPGDKNFELAPQIEAIAMKKLSESF